MSEADLPTGILQLAQLQTPALHESEATRLFANELLGAVRRQLEGLCADLRRVSMIGIALTPQVPKGAAESASENRMFELTARESGITVRLSQGLADRLIVASLGGAVDLAPSEAKNGPNTPIRGRLVNRVSRLLIENITKLVEERVGPAGASMDRKTPKDAEAELGMTFALTAELHSVEHRIELVLPPELARRVGRPIHGRTIDGLSAEGFAERLEAEIRSTPIEAELILAENVMDLSMLATLQVGMIICSDKEPQDSFELRSDGLALVTAEIKRGSQNLAIMVQDTLLQAGAEHA